mgnify:CR=1 FL=1
MTPGPQTAGKRYTMSIMRDGVLLAQGIAYRFCKCVVETVTTVLVFQIQAGAYFTLPHRSAASATTLRYWPSTLGKPTIPTKPAIILSCAVGEMLACVKTTFCVAVR